MNNRFSRLIAIFLCIVFICSLSSCFPTLDSGDWDDYNPSNSDNENPGNPSNPDDEESNPDNKGEESGGDNEDDTGIESSSCFTFELNSDGNSYTLTGRNSYDEDELIIDYHNGKPVTKIAKEALDYGDFTSVSIGNSVTHIEKAAFKRKLSLFQRKMQPIKRHTTGCLCAVMQHMGHQ